MKALGIADRAGATRFISQRIHYTLNAREAEYEPRSLWIKGSARWCGARWRAACFPASASAGRKALTMPTMAESWDELPNRGEKALYDIVDTLIDIAKQRDASASRTGWHACLGNRTLPRSLSAPAPRKNNLKAIELSQTDDELQGPRPS
jgi:hypothetical protein